MPYTHTGDDPPTVLIVEDQSRLADLFELWLGDAYTVTVAYDCETALELLDETIDVATLDRNLPDGQGGEIIAAIRDRELDCRVAVVSAVEPTIDVIEMCFDEYLSKPITKAELREAVEQLLARAEYDEALSESYTIASKLAMIETHCSAEELADNEDVAALRARFDELQEELTSTEEGFVQGLYPLEQGQCSANSN